MKFDAYCGNVRGLHAEQVAEVVAFSCKARVERARGRRRYSDVFEVNDGNLGVGWCGTDTALDAAYFEFKGAATPQAVESVRRHWPAPQHTVSRMDACEDYDAPGVCERLVSIVDANVDPRVQSSIIAPRNGDRGRTFYWGTRQSQAMVRVYEAGKLKDRLHFNRPNWVRAEAEMHPHKSLLKIAAAALSPVEAWGLAGWTTRVAEHLCQVDVPRFSVPQDPPRFDTTTLYLARTFRRHWEAMLEDYGDFECIGRELREVWRLDDEAGIGLDQAGPGR
jgi:hypothetical protein